MSEKYIFYSSIKYKLFHDKFTLIDFKSSIYKMNKNKIKGIFSQKIILLNFIFIKLFILFSLLIKSNNNIDNELNYSYITLKANKTGYIKILSNNYHFMPNEVWINDINQKEVKNEYYLNDTNDIIKLIWYEIPLSINFLFEDCSNITEIDLSNFNTSDYGSMTSIFSRCTSLQKVNLSNINTSIVKNMKSMFYDCSSLTSLDLSYFETSKVSTMESMFSGCSSLIYLNLTNFNTLRIDNIDRMFYNCTSLSSLIFPYLDIKQVTHNYGYFLGGCLNLKFLDLKEAEIKDDNIIYDMFSSVHKNILVCTNNNIHLSIIFPKYYFVNCMKNIDEKYYFSLCYTNDSNIYNNKHACDICGSNFVQIYGHSESTSTQIKCYESIDNYCPNYFYYNLSSNIIFCTEDKKCPDDYNKLIEEKNQCIDNCENDPIYKYEDNNICKNETKIGTIKNPIINPNKRKELINNIIQELINNYTDINNGKDKKRYEKNLSIILTSTLNQKNNEKKNNITINLGQCEDIIIKNYNLSNNDSLYILQIISEEPGMKIPKIEYEVYYPLYNNSNLTRLDLSFCKDTKIEISISVKINDELDKYNPKSDYYNNICYKTTSISGTDISLKDRRNEFVYNNMSLCEENCDLINYNYITEKVKCSCGIKLNIPSDYDIKFNKNDFFKNFIDINNVFNLSIMNVIEQY